ncbi:hypothetical protein Dsin_005812 [Dipteronia sinensis]|uniref:Uncharacterized protein n=1 Tax=Dipteronia sinensis TaxID=43782 RepID=A0AAE0AY16_9ROSI|nr:hypothetical protein Dsin_005812 [Dipteronia sinensis]
MWNLMELNLEVMWMLVSDEGWWIERDEIEGDDDDLGLAMMLKFLGKKLAMTAEIFCCEEEENYREDEENHYEEDNHHLKFSALKNKILLIRSQTTLFNDALNCENKENGSGTIVQRWRAPPVGSFKVNVDVE